MAHNSIMTESQRATRKFSDTDICKRCGKYSESTLHAIRDCETVMPLWKTLVKQEYWSKFFSLNEKDWIKYNLDNNCSKNHVDKHLEFISWKPPKQDWMKINVDGSHRKDDNSICCGGVVRDNSGRWITGFTKRLGHGSAFQAEIWAILLGLRFSHDKGFPKVIIETDSIMALNFVQSNTDIQHPLGGIRARIRELLSMDWQVKLVHTYREGNMVADALANAGHDQLLDIRISESIPSVCIFAFQNDCSNLSLPRWVGS
ncbi:reverse transcriptase [Senna tora]|uniref:Reverse transcriptase n=1 Tax=Senna tora TaxID=362788 RepID=A0A834XC01_9FABA|nr:reverse transcriptase [Senna tora]